ncbi:uncharacterized protein BJ212DRAFT_1480496 [Suillus subaureus]|uniref:DUF6532 domain-containing protein n=1 Tax=Suillus subaureus TaxID=48587 RepID=A0A9P7ED27_9AGAM|nr:uncharacterized protein BJ212DRAFT_1480496 [Suillus subaureus]KAG1817266.1 hypothetical protein BJ212DRAFT_1480496 [Suillus subaureus]
MPAQCAGSPKKRKTKCKAVDSDLGKTLSSVEEKAKRSWIQSQADVSPPVKPPQSVPDLDDTDNSNLRHTNHAGAGKGGRNSQLERISALLEAPGQATKPKGSTTLDSNVPVNPLAPLPPSKGHRSRSKAPPLYSASQPVVDSSTLPPRKQGKKVKKIAAFASNIKAPNQPNFVQRKDGECFGFHPSISPSCTEKVLDASLKTTSVEMRPHPQADFYANIDPSLWPISQEAQGEASYCGASLPSIGQEAQAEVSTSEDDDSSTDDTDESDTDEESDKDNGEIGWGGVHGSHSVHPDENVAIGSLTVDKTSSSSSSSSNIMSEPTKLEDVLQSHHKKNGCPHLPDPEMLDLIHCQETQATNTKLRNSGIKAKVKSAKSKAPTEGPKLTQLSWYPPQWKTFLEEAKSECHVQHAIENAFLDAVKDLPLSVTEALMSSLVEWLEAGNEVEVGIWPEHKANMAKLLYEDLSTWHSNLKKIAISIMPSMYNLIPPAEVPPQACTAWVENAASELLDKSFFLHDSVDDLGKTNNTAHPALKAAAVAFFYTGSYRITHRRPNVFKEELPLESLALVCAVYNCIFDRLIKNGSGKYFPKFTAKDYSSVYFSMVAKLKNIMKHKYHGPKLT